MVPPSHAKLTTINAPHTNLLRSFLENHSGLIVTHIVADLTLIAYKGNGV